MKYIKLRSVTWWASATPIIGGVFIAFEPVHALHDWAAATSAMFGNAPPAVLINAGLAGIGLRGAIK
ncbi:hypothetical protein OE699_02070 [Sedimentimonas flavescens]|uniref:Holin n=1 Tax=Sedimentimonas flavescens TaxID=2851012 RepID=A0ABT2ZVF5_9RHOB|nr:hypothetical protein [Sedimentimonas flavescens]MCV2877626.1 hypothetical protein [Sedimentimonas flavescens]